MPETLPADFHNWNRALRGAFLKGCRAHASGEAIGCCPYADRRKSNGRPRVRHEAS